MRIEKRASFGFVEKKRTGTTKCADLGKGKGDRADVGGLRADHALGVGAQARLDPCKDLRGGASYDREALKADTLCLVQSAKRPPDSVMLQL